MWTVEDITNLCVKYCGKAGVKFNSPVVINGRLTRTLGRCYYQKCGNVVNPIRIEISRQLLETSTDECVREVIAHECAHYVTAALTHESHGHDSTFKFYCDKIGTTNSSTTYDNLERTVKEDKIFKYTIYCSKCGKFVGGRSRACNVTKHPEGFQSNCCKADLKIIQNW